MHPNTVTRSTLHYVLYSERTALLLLLLLLALSLVRDDRTSLDTSIVYYITFIVHRQYNIQVHRDIRNLDTRVVIPSGKFNII